MLYNKEWDKKLVPDLKYPSVAGLAYLLRNLDLMKDNNQVQAWKHSAGLAVIVALEYWPNSMDNAARYDWDLRGTLGLHVSYGDYRLLMFGRSANNNKADTPDAPEVVADRLEQFANVNYDMKAMADKLSGLRLGC